MKYLCIVSNLLFIVLLTDCKGDVQTARMEIHQDAQLQDLECPTWFIPSSNNTQCECGKPIGGAINCNQTSKRVSVRTTLCMTYNNVTKGTLASKCPFSDLRRPDIQDEFAFLPNYTSELNEFMCGKMNRVGQMCHKCKPGFGPAVLSFKHKCLRCVNTSYGWLMYLLLACFPTTFLFFIAVIFQVRITSSSMNGFVFYVQYMYYNIVTYPQKFFGYTETARAVFIAFTSFFGFWNLDFLRFLVPPFCISDRLTNLHVLSMEYLVALFPLFLTALIYIIIQLHARDCRILVSLWRPFSVCFAPIMRKYQWNPADSMVHVFVTFLILSYSKFLFVSFTLLMYSPVFNTSGAVVGVMLYYDASVTFFSREHLPFALTAITVSFVFNILPLLVVFLYPTQVFQKCLNCSRIRWHAVHAFADAFNGCYKDGTKGTWDYRYFAGFYLLLRILFFISLMVNQVICASVTIGLLLFALCRPYKKNMFHILDSIYLMIMLSMCMFPSFKSEIDILMDSLLLLYFIVYILTKILLKVQCQCLLTPQTFIDQVANTEQAAQTNMRDGQDGELPDRVVNPERYRLLPESTKQNGDQNSGGNIRPVTVATYGIV